MASTLVSTRGGQVEQFSPADRITCTVAAGQTVRGGRLVELTGTRTVQEAGAGSNTVLGVAMYDGAAGEKISVATVGVWYLLAGGVITAGAALIAAAAGTVVVAGAAPDARQVVARAWEAISNAATGPCRLLC